MTKSTDTSFKFYTAEQIGEKPVYCPICGKEKMWVQIPMFEKVHNICVQCECEQEERESRRKALKSFEMEQKKKRVVSNATIPKKLLNAKFGAFEPIAENKAVYDKCKDYAESFNKHTETGFCLYGGAGVGKSHLAAAVADKLLENGYSVKFRVLPELLYELRATYNGEGNEREIIDYLCNVDLLILDDAGAEKPSEWVQEKIYLVVNSRYNHSKPIILTTNSETMLGLKDIVGFRTYDRLIEMCEPLAMTGKSYRRQKAKERYFKEEIK